MVRRIPKRDDPRNSSCKHKSYSHCCWVTLHSWGRSELSDANFQCRRRPSWSGSRSRSCQYQSSVGPGQQHYLPHLIPPISSGLSYDARRHRCSSSLRTGCPPLSTHTWLSHRCRHAKPFHLFFWRRHCLRHCLIQTQSSWNPRRLHKGDPRFRRLFQYLILGCCIANCVHILSTLLWGQVFIQKRLRNT